MGDINLFPKRIVIDGRQRIATVGLYNKVPVSGEYEITVSDKAMTPDGRLVELVDADPATRARVMTASQMLRWSPRRLVLQGNESQTVRIMARTPPDLPPGEYRSHFMAIAVPPPEQLGNSIEDALGQGGNNRAIGVQLIPRFGISIPVIVRVGETTLNAGLRDFSIVRAPDGSRAMAFTITRSGTRSAFGDIAITAPGVRKPVGEIKGVGVYTEIDSRRVTVPVDPLADPRATAPGAKLIVTYIDDDAEPGHTLAPAGIHRAVMRPGGVIPIGPLRLGTALLGALLLRGDAGHDWLPAFDEDPTPPPPGNGRERTVGVLPHPAVRMATVPWAAPQGKAHRRQKVAASVPRPISTKAHLLASTGAVPLSNGDGSVAVAAAKPDLPLPQFTLPPDETTQEPAAPVADIGAGSPVIVAETDQPVALTDPQQVAVQTAAPPEPVAPARQPSALLVPETVGLQAGAAVAIAPDDIAPIAPESAVPAEQVAGADPLPAAMPTPPDLALSAVQAPGPGAAMADPAPPPPAAREAPPQTEPPPVEVQRTVATTPAPTVPDAPQAAASVQPGEATFPLPALAASAPVRPTAKVASLAASRASRTARRSIPARKLAPLVEPSPQQTGRPLVANDAQAVFPEPTFGQVRRSEAAPAPGPADFAAAQPQSAALSGQSQNPVPQRAALAPSPGSASFPPAGPPSFSYDDELILQIKVAGVPGDDTLVAYGTRSGVYLPFGALARFLDLGIAVSDEGHYASGWFLDPKRTLTIDLRQHTLTLLGRESPLAPGDAVAFDGELYLRAERYADLLPLAITTDLRDQSVTIRTSEPFPFEQRLKRDADREKLAARSSLAAQPRWPREETPWRALSIPMADVELRAVSDSTYGTRGEADVRLAGDLAFLSAQAFLSATSRDGLVSSHVELGRVDADGDLLGPLKATEFALGDVATPSLPMGLRGSGGRGAMIGNVPVESRSVFDRIDLRGNLPDGYEVELYRNGVLIDSTREAINGEYRFEQVSLDYGINVLRLVFYGPQGQRSEEVRQISVGDGRLAKGQFVYSAGLVQKDVNLFDVRGPRFFRSQDFGAWRAAGQVSYGLSSGVTATMGGAWFQSDRGTRWLGTAGLRTGIGGIAAKLDLGVADHGAKAAEIGLGAKLFGMSVTLNHAEYRGRFVDEVRSLTSDYLKRVTEIDANATIEIGSGLTGLSIPLVARARRIEFRDGRTQANASLRASTRFSGLVASNTFDYSETSGNGPGRRQLLGNFDLATLSRAKLQVRANLGYAVLPSARITSAGIEVDRALDEHTLLHGSVNHSFDGHETQFGLSAVRRFDRFTVALDGSYGLRQKSYAVGLRLGASFGRNPIDGRVFMATPGQAASGAIALRAFRDADGDRRFGPGDAPLPDVEFFSGNRLARTDAAGVAMMTGLGSGNRASVQVDLKTLPDIDLSPASRGIEIVPRPGRVHVTDFAVLEMSEIEGTAYFAGGDSARGVSGLRLQLVDAAGKQIKTVKTESDGFYLFEQVPPGHYAIVLDPEQAARLRIRLGEPAALEVGAKSAVLNRKLVVETQ